MRKILFFILLISGICFMSTLNAQGFSVERFTADYYLYEEGYFDVVEHYDIRFTEPKHGIFREIFTDFDFVDDQGQTTKRNIYISEVEVPGHPYSVKGEEGSLFQYKTLIQIGDKDKLVEGAQHYEIRYRVKNALIFTADQVMLYWNAKPSGWYSVFNHCVIRVHGPKGAALSSKNCFLYAGMQGDRTPSDRFLYRYAGADYTASAKDGFFSLPGQSITVLVKMPKQLIKEVDFRLPFWKRHLLAEAALVLLSGLLGWIFIRKRASKVTAVTSYYPPEGIDPAMAGVLIDNMTDARDMTSLLPYWATAGIIKMEAIEKSDRSLHSDLKLVMLRPLPEQYAGYAHNLFEKIFLSGLRPEVRVSSLKGVFAEPLKLLTLSAKKYYASEHKGVMIFVIVLSLIWAFFSISAFPYFIKDYVNIEGGGFIGFCIINFLFFFLVFPVIISLVHIKYRRKNEEGKAVMAELLGFRTFIIEAELPRIKELLESDPNYFEKTMPYAISFNLLSKWAAKFEQLAQDVPAWYSNTSHASMNFHLFTNSLNNSMTVARTAIVVVPASSSSSSRSSGGGFSGGGAGGGGGGSW